MKKMVITHIEFDNKGYTHGTKQIKVTTTNIVVHYEIDEFMGSIRLFYENVKDLSLMELRELIYEEATENMRILVESKDKYKE